MNYISFYLWTPYNALKTIKHKPKTLNSRNAVLNGLYADLKEDAKPERAQRTIQLNQNQAQTLNIQEEQNKQLAPIINIQTSLRSFASTFHKCQHFSSYNIHQNVSMIRKHHNHTLQANPRHSQEESQQYIRKTIKGKAVSSLYCKTIKDTKYNIAKQEPNIEPLQTMGATLNNESTTTTTTTTTTTKQRSLNLHMTLAVGGTLNTNTATTTTTAFERKAAYVTMGLYTFHW